MGPVDKGAAPRVYANYQDAGSDLQKRLGDYCSYCEWQIETYLAVEHIQPKSHMLLLGTSWSNFLLACVNYNSNKGSTPVNLSDYFWPDVDNTLRAFEHVPGGLIRPHPTLEPHLTAKAHATISLVGLDRDPGNPGREPTLRDNRWYRRLRAWQVAQRCRNNVAAQDTAEMRDTVVMVATGRGIFSIWCTVFAGDADMRRRLREAFVGTHRGSFDANEDLVPRDGGQV